MRRESHPSLTKFAFRLVDRGYYRRVWRAVDHFAIEQSHQAFQVFDFVDGDSVEVAVPDRNVGFLAYLERTDLVFQEHLARAPGGVAAEGGMHIDGFCHSEGVQAVGAFGGLARWQKPTGRSGRQPG